MKNTKSTETLYDESGDSDTVFDVKELTGYMKVETSWVNNQYVGSKESGQA